MKYIIVPLKAMKHSKTESVGHIAQFQIMNPHQRPIVLQFRGFIPGQSISKTFQF